MFGFFASLVNHKERREFKDKENTNIQANVELPSLRSLRQFLFAGPADGVTQQAQFEQL